VKVPFKERKLIKPTLNPTPEKDLQFLTKKQSSNSAVQHYMYVKTPNRTKKNIMERLNGGEIVWYDWNHEGWLRGASSANS